MIFLIGVQYDENHELVLGFTEPLTYKDLEDKNFTFEAQYLKKNLVTEADVVLFTSLDGTVKFALGYHLQSGAGKSGKELLDKYSKSVKIMQCCEECVRNTGHTLNALKEEVITRCNSFCENCWSNGSVCQGCSEVGRKTIFPQFEKCFACIEKKVSCVKNVPFVVALDCFSGNRALMLEIQNQRENGSLDPSLHITEFLPEIVHMLKTVKCSMSNWFLLGNNLNLINLVLLRTLRDDNTKAEVI